MRTLREILRDHPIITFSAALASLVTVISFIFLLYSEFFKKKNIKTTQKYSASGTILTSDSLPIPHAYYSYTLNKKLFFNKADDMGNYRIEIDTNASFFITVLCKNGSDSVNSSVRLVNPDIYSQNIIFAKKIIQTKIPVTTTNNNNNSTENKPKTNDTIVTPKNSTQLEHIIKLQDYILIPDNNGNEIPYYSTNTINNQNDSPIGFLDYQTTLTTLIIPEEKNKESILFAFYDKNKNRPTKGWIKIKYLKLKVFN